MTTEEFRKISSNIPHQPGIYKYVSSEGKVLYVGKAKNLFKRVSSYFNKNDNSRRINQMLHQTATLEFTAVNSEQDALILENNLIKAIQPKYNILLKDGKTYPYICIKKERFPRVFSTRKVIKDGSEYLGPFTSGVMVKSLLELIKDSYKIRTCNYNLSEENVNERKYKVCLDYHIKKCLGPCEAKQSEAEYNEQIEAVRKILKGDIKTVIKEVQEKMLLASEELKFEEAHEYSKTMQLLSKYQAKSEIAFFDIEDLEVFTVLEHDGKFYVNYSQVKNSSLLFSKTMDIKSNLEEGKEHILADTVYRVREDMRSESKLILSNIEIDLDFLGLKTHIPQRGAKKDLLKISVQNLKIHIENKIKEKENRKAISKAIMQLKMDLQLKDVPYHIECFDNSNIQGTSPVASCVVFKNGKPSKRDYRHFHIKTVEGPDDFASMKEIVYRRYRRLLEERQALPQLIVIDGGKGQLSSALESLQDLNLIGKVTIIGIAKRLEELYFPGDSLPLYLDKKSMSLKLLQQLRNEAHRFAITFHRKTRSKNTFHNELTDIKGIGEIVAKKLLQEFRSVGKISETDIDALASVIGKAKAKLIWDHFNK